MKHTSFSFWFYPFSCSSSSSSTRTLYTHTQKTESHLRIKYVLDCAQAERILPVFQSAIKHSNRIPLDIFLPCRTRSIIRILTHVHIVHRNIHVCAGFLLATAFHCLSFFVAVGVVVVPILVRLRVFVYIGIVLCTLLLSYVYHTKMRNQAKQNKNLSNHTLHFPKRFGTPQSQSQTQTVCIVDYVHIRNITFHNTLYFDTFFFCLGRSFSIEFSQCFQVLMLFRFFFIISF